MKPKDRTENLARLQDLSELIRNLEAAKLHAAVLARQASEARLADLAQPIPDTHLSPIAGAIAEIRWQKWADKRRAEINITLARQIAACNDAQDRVNRAFARANVLRQLMERKDQAS
jgi:hypothetical protein